MAYAEVTEVAERKLTFRVWAEDETDLISEGTHERIVVDLERFDKRISRKAGKVTR
ncbi:MAG: hypothetical protein HKN42_05110 [Granulosicoccus sp.]|nr:hypothetical protein [Granulosicoccus sp.]